MTCHEAAPRCVFFALSPLMCDSNGKIWGQRAGSFRPMHSLLIIYPDRPAAVATDGADCVSAVVEGRAERLGGIYFPAHSPPRAFLPL